MIWNVKIIRTPEKPLLSAKQGRVVRRETAVDYAVELRWNISIDWVFVNLGQFGVQVAKSFKVGEWHLIRCHSIRLQY